LRKIKIDFFKCKCGFQATLNNDISNHVKQNLKMVNGLPNLEGHVFTNMKGKTW